jgi:mRNA interferase RelE/StbE
MGEFRILFRESVRKDLQSLPNSDLTRILDRIASLSINPRPRGSEKLTDQDRCRIRQGDCSIVYSIENDRQEIWIVRVGHHRIIYR